MKNATEHAKKLRSLLRRTKAAPEPTAQPQELLDLMVYAFLLWETTTRQADAAYNRLMRQVVDLNDLRVTDPDDLMLMVGERYSMLEQRIDHLRRALHAVYLSEHAMSLERINALGKRESRAFIEGLDGMVPFVSAYLLLHGLGAHAMPVDETLHAKLVREGAVHEDATIEDAQGFLEHQVKAADGPKVALQLRTIGETGGSRPAKKAAPAKKTTKKTTKKKTAKKTAKKTTKKKTSKKTTKRR